MARDGEESAIARDIRYNGGTANSLKSILKMLEALAVLKYSSRKKEVQPPLTAERRRRMISRVFSR